MPGGWRNPWLPTKPGTSPRRPGAASSAPSSATGAPRPSGRSPSTSSSRASFVVLYAGFSPSRCHLVLARSESLDLDLRTLVPVVAPLVDGRGGGGPSLVEIAGNPAADVEAALARAAEAVEKYL